MAGLTSLILATHSLLIPTLAFPTPSTSLTPRDSSINITISAVSTSPSINGLTFGLYQSAAGSYTGYLYDHGSIPLSYSSAFTLDTSTSSNPLLTTAANSSIQVTLEASDEISAGPQGTPGWYVVPGSLLLGFDLGSEIVQHTYSACKWTGDQGAGILYTVGWVMQPGAGAGPGEGCELVQLTTDG